jgi:hypothetical protein
VLFFEETGENGILKLNIEQRLTNGDLSLSLLHEKNARLNIPDKLGQ